MIKPYHKRYKALVDVCIILDDLLPTIHHLSPHIRVKINAVSMMVGILARDIYRKKWKKRRLREE